MTNAIWGCVTLWIFRVEIHRRLIPHIIDWKSRYINIYCRVYFSSFVAGSLRTFKVLLKGTTTELHHGLIIKSTILHVRSIYSLSTTDCCWRGSSSSPTSRNLRSLGHVALYLSFKNITAILFSKENDEFLLTPSLCTFAIDSFS